MSTMSTRSPAQDRALETITVYVSTVLTELRRDQPDVVTWLRIQKRWDGTIRLGHQHLVPEYDASTGTASIGLDSNGSVDRLDRATLRIMNELIVNTATRPNCSTLTRDAIHAAKRVGLVADLTCVDIENFGLVGDDLFDRMGCDDENHDRRPEFEELLGRDADDAVAMIRAVFPGVHVVVRNWDLINGQSTYDDFADDETMVITIDPVTNKVVAPTPRFASTPIQYGAEDSCFMKPDDGRCIGVPRIAPGTWSTMLGKPLPDVVATMKWEYPHALIVPTPISYRIPRTRRPDRIRVIFDPATSFVVRILIG